MNPVVKVHYDTSRDLLREAEKHSDNAAAQQVCVTAAQVQATLALVVATSELRP